MTLWIWTGGGGGTRDSPAAIRQIFGAALLAFKLLTAPRLPLVPAGQRTVKLSTGLFTTPCNPAFYATFVLTLAGISLQYRYVL